MIGLPLRSEGLGMDLPDPEEMAAGLRLALALAWLCESKDSRTGSPITKGFVASLAREARRLKLREFCLLAEKIRIRINRLFYYFWVISKKISNSRNLR